MQHRGGATRGEPSSRPGGIRSFTADPPPLRQVPARHGKPISIAIRADDPLALAGTRHLLEDEPGLVVVGPRDATPASNGSPVTILIVDRLDDGTAVELRRLTREGDTEVVLITEFVREAELMLALECGVRSILRRREVTAPDLAAAVRAATRHESRLPPDLLGQLMTHVGRTERARSYGQGTTASPVGVSTREVEILRLLAEGLDTREVAVKLAYSERTIKNTLHGLTTRLNLRNRTHAVAYAFSEGYL